MVVKTNITNKNMLTCVVLIITEKYSANTINNINVTIIIPMFQHAIILYSYIN